jgi:probable HAF family extracellular repeat protein
LPVLIAALGLAAASSQAFEITFTLVDGPGGASARPNGINASGKIALYGGGTPHSFLWDQGAFTPIEVPGARGTTALAINAADQVIGTFDDGGPYDRGFLWDKGTITLLDAPGALTTQPRAINAHGQIVGLYVDTSFGTHAFLWDKGQFKTIDPPGAGGARANGINAAGQIVGGSGDHGLLWDQGTFTTIDFPGPGVFATQAFAINAAGQIVGRFGNAFSNLFDSFLWEKGVFTRIDRPPDATSLEAIAINPAGQVVGTYGCCISTQVFTSHGFLWDKGTLTTIDPPGAAITEIFGINAVGEFVGWSTPDRLTQLHGFLARFESFSDPAVVNASLATAPLKTSFNGTPVLDAPAGTLSLRATFTNTGSTPIRNPVFKVTSLTGGNLLLNADGGPGGVGANLSPEIVVRPQESWTTEFVIGLQARQRFEFFVDVTGVSPIP